MKKFSFLILGIFFQISLIANYSYDENGNIASVYIPENGEVLYRYDPIQRLVETLYPNEKHFSYTYDYNSNLCFVENPDGTTNYTYDKLNRIEIVHFLDGSSLSIISNRSYLKSLSQTLERSVLHKRVRPL